MKTWKSTIIVVNYATRICHARHGHHRILPNGAVMPMPGMTNPKNLVFCNTLDDVRNIAMVIIAIFCGGNATAQSVNDSIFLPVESAQSSPVEDSISLPIEDTLSSPGEDSISHFLLDESIPLESVLPSPPVEVEIPIIPKVVLSANDPVLLVWKFDSCLVAGDAYFYMGQYDSARTAFAEAHRLNPAKEAPQIGQYNSLLYGNNILAAARQAEKLFARFPSSANRQRVAYTAGLLGVPNRIENVADQMDSSDAVYRWGIVGLGLRQDYFNAAVISLNAYSRTKMPEFLEDYHSYRDSTGYVPFSGTAWGSLYSFNKDYPYADGYAGGVATHFGSLVNQVSVNAGQSITRGRFQQKGYRVDYALDSVRHYVDTLDRWHYSVPLTGWDSTSEQPVRSGSSVWLPAPRDSFTTSNVSYTPQSIVQTDVHLDWNHLFSAKASAGVQGRFTQVKNDLVKQNIMGGIVANHTLGNFGLRHRGSFNAVRYRSQGDSLQQIQTLVTTDQSIRDTLFTYTYFNRFRNYELDTLLRTVMDSAVSYERWAWTEQSTSGKIATIKTLQYDLGIDRTMGPFSASLDGSVRWFAPNTAGIPSGLRYHGSGSLAGVWRFGALRLALSRGDLFLLDQSSTLNTVPRLRQYAIEAGAALTPWKWLGIGYELKIDRIEEYTCTVHSLAVTITPDWKRH
jgi:tetratricopeptide (TPR) repeat protein